MAAEPLTIEELIDRATDINNHGSSVEAAQRVANQVNKEIGGCSTAVRCLIQRLQLHQEVVTLQTLMVAESCVQNCGSKFHSEIGKYKFINELIKLLSPKYDGDITPPAVKERVKELLFSWYCGLPQEKKIAEAYKMLKQQGIIKHDPVDPTRTKPQSYKEQKSVIEDDDSSQLLATLLASNDPEDLHSANKLIKSMVKQEEDRLDRVCKRVQDLETVSNNVKLLDEMLQKFDSSPSAVHDDLELMHDLYESCLKLRPELFSLASKSLDDKDDSMAEILSANDELTRVIDSYKEKILLQKGPSKANKPFNVPNDTNSSALLDLGLDGPVSGASNDTNTATNENAGNSLLDEQFKLLGIDSPAPSTTSQQQPPMHNVGLVNQLSQSTWQTQQQQQHYGAFPAQQPMFQTPAPPMQTSQQLIGALRPMAPAGMGVPSQTTVNRPPPQLQKEPTETKKKNDLLDFDVFSEFRTPTLMTSNAGTKPADQPDGASQSAMQNLYDMPVNPLPAASANDILAPSNTQNSTANKENNASLLDISTPAQVPSPVIAPASKPTPQPVMVAPQPTPTQPLMPASPPLVHQENYTVPLEALQPVSSPTPSLVYEKNGLKTLLHMAKDTRDTANSNVITTILSTISTSTSAVTDFSIQVAVPKVMRVKLQPATSTQLNAYNPILPPPSISQVMLIANPSKESIRLRFRVSYKLNGIAYNENSSIDQLPQVT
eukprot:TCONS_00027659-protein